MKPPRKNHPRRTRINSRLPSELRQRLAEHSATKGIYECEAIRAAVEQYLDGTSDMTLLYRRLDSMNRNLNRLHRTLDLHGEIIKEYVLVYLKNTPRLPAVDQEATLREAARRYQSIIERVAASFSAGKTWVDDLPKETLSPMLPDKTESERSANSPGTRQ